MTDNLVQTWGDVLIASFQRLFGGIVAFVPMFIFALIVFVVGMVIAVALGRLVAQVVRSLKVDHALRSLGFEEHVERAGFHLDSGAFLGGLVRWFFILVFLLAAFDVLQLKAVTDFLGQVVLVYVPQVIVAALVLLVAAVVGDIASRVVAGAARAAHMPSAGLLGGVVKWSIWVFAILAALFQLGVFRELILTVIQAFVYMLALAGGLAFGLGGKEAAARYIDKLHQDISSHHSH